MWKSLHHGYIVQKKVSLKIGLFSDTDTCMYTSEHIYGPVINYGEGAGARKWDSRGSKKDGSVLHSPFSMAKT